MALGGRWIHASWVSSARNGSIGVSSGLAFVDSYSREIVALAKGALDSSSWSVAGCVLLLTWVPILWPLLSLPHCAVQ